MSNDENTNDKLPITVSDFKNWLSGVRDFQPEDWVPNLDQWNKILDKIEQLDELSEPMPYYSGADRTVVNALSSEAVAISASATAPNPAPVRTRPHAPLSEAAVTLPDTPIRPAPKQITVSKVSAPTRDETGKIVNTGDMYKTGVIDTSDKNYESQFK
jgi:hypothetical protein